MYCSYDGKNITTAVSTNEGKEHDNVFDEEFALSIQSCEEDDLEEYENDENEDATAEQVVEQTVPECEATATDAGGE